MNSIYGDDIDVMSKDKEFENIFNRYYGPRDETTFQFFRRGYNSVVNKIINPKRSTYSSDDLVFDGFELQDFQIFSQNLVLWCCKWKNLNIACVNRCIIYLHTNTRNLSDSREVVALCHNLKCHLISMDLPGAGKSEGHLSCHMVTDFEKLIAKIKNDFGDNIEIILWSRGLATAIAIEYCFKYHNFEKSRAQANIIYLVLDSPFTSIENMIKDCITRLKAEGYSIPLPLFYIFEKLARHVLKGRLGGIDPYSIRPIDICNSIAIPCTIIAVQNDDYIPFQQSLSIAEKWNCSCSFLSIDGRHFGMRNTDTVLSIGNHIAKACDY